MGAVNEYLPSRIKRNMSNAIDLAGNAYPYSCNAAAQAIGVNATTASITTSSYPRDNDMVGMFKILRAEDGFVVKCAQGEGYAHKTYVASDIDEALNKAKVYLVTEALNK